MYDYQLEYLSKLPKSDAVMAAEMGTGKTRMALYEANKRFPGVARLVIAPASVVRAESWQREAQALGIEEPVVMSYETIRRRPETVEQLSKSKFFLILDESHAIKVPTTKQARAVQKIRKGAVQTFLLSATPIPNGWKDWAGYSILLGHTKNWTEFREKYEVRKKAFFGNFYQTVGYRNVKTLEAQFESVARRLDRSEANELPDKQFIQLSILPSPKYTKIERERMYNGEPLDNFPKLINALRQSTIETRVPDLTTILEGTNENVVVFYNYKLEASAIEKIAKTLKKKIFYANGDKHTLPSKGTWDSIENSVTIAQYQSASEGVEMTYASICVYFSPTYSYKNYYQSQGRLHRNGQTKKCVFYEFDVVKTVDDQIWKALNNKQDFDTKLWAQSEHFDVSQSGSPF